MKKHIFGFALFSLIVGTAIFIYGMFSVAGVEKVYQPIDYSNYAETKSCWRMKGESSIANLGSPKVSQAVFNLKTKEFDWSLETPEIATPIALHFFVKDKKGTHYVATETILGITSQNIQREINQRAANNRGGFGEAKFIGSFSSLDNLDSYKNLYVIAEFVSIPQIRDNDFHPEFDAEKAVPVLIDSGK